MAGPDRGEDRPGRRPSPGGRTGRRAGGGRWLAAAAIALAVLAPADRSGAAAAPGPHLEVRRVDATAAPEMSLLVVVPGQPVGTAPVPGHSFAVYEDGVYRPTESRPVRGDELAVGLVVDNAPALDEQQLRTLQTAAVELLLRLPSDTRVVVAGTAGPVPSAFESPAAAVARISVASERSAARPPDAVDSVVQMLRPGGPGHPEDAPPTVVLLAGPATGWATSTTPEDLAQAGVAVSVLAIGGPAPASLEATADRTGGRTVTGDATTLRAGAARLADELASSYVVTYRSQGAASTTQVHLTTADGSATAPVPVAPARSAGPVASGEAGPRDRSDGGTDGVPWTSVAAMASWGVALGLVAIAVREATSRSGSPRPLAATARSMTWILVAALTAVAVAAMVTASIV